MQVAKRLEKMGAPYFAVATIPEGAELREAGIETPILILGYVDEKDMDTAAQYGITVPVYDRETAELISAAAERTGKPVTVHYKLDTGMTRLGFPSWECEQTVQDILACSKLPGLISEGIFTHFAVADVPSGEAYTELQYKRFSDVCEGLQAAGLDLPLRHCANSGAIQTYEKMHCTMTRAGIILYGYRPDASVPPVLDRSWRPPSEKLKPKAGSKRSLMISCLPSPTNISTIIPSRKCTVSSRRRNASSTSTSGRQGKSSIISWKPKHPVNVPATLSALGLNAVSAAKALTSRQSPLTAVRRKAFTPVLSTV